MKSNHLLKSSLFFLTLILTGCKENSKKYSQKKEIDFYFFDVLGDSGLDTIIIENSLNIVYNKSISILNNGKKSLICELAPRLDSTYFKTSPKIENIYIEANAVQTKNKGFRLLSRNTDIEPEYFFIDFWYNKYWYVQEVGFLNISSKNYFLCKQKIDRNIMSFNKLQIDPKYFNDSYFNGKYCK